MTTYNPHDYQKRMIGMIQTGQSVALWADMGMGKTVSVLTAVREMMPVKVLVLAPKLVAEETWPAEVSKWSHLKGLRLAKLAGTPTQREAVLEDIDNWDVAVLCRNLLPWLFERHVKWNGAHTKWSWARAWPFDTVVLDESASYKNPSGTWFKTMARIKRAGCQVVELTGTPSPRGIDDLWAQAYLLDQGERLGRGITAFRERWMYPDKIIRNGAQTIVTSWLPKQGAFGEIMGLLSDVSVSLRAEDWLKMPDKVINEIRVSLPTGALGQYRRMERDAVLQLRDAEITAGSAATVVGKLLQMANGCVYDEAREIHDIHHAKREALEELVEGATSPVLVFYSYQHDYEAIKSIMPTAVKLDGPDVIEQWNAGKIPVLLAHPASAGHGLNLQGGGSTIVWYGLPYNLEWYQQANARLYRQGQQAPSVIIHHIIANGTVDEAVLAALTRKEAVQNDVLAAVRYQLC